MRRLLFILSLFTIVFCNVSILFAAEDFDELKEWEHQIYVGYKYYTEYKESSATLGFEAKNRIGYPFLLGFALGVSYSENDVLSAEASIPFAVRVPVADKVRVDVSVRPGVMYITNLENKADKVSPMIGGCINGMYFYKTGKSIGLTACYTQATSSLNNVIAAITIGF